jgi:oligopeptidase B
MLSNPRILVAGPLLAFLPLLPSQAPVPPVAKRVDHEATWHGRKFVDPWFWLREKQSPEVRGYLEAENAYTTAMTQSQELFRDTLYKEMVARVKQTDLSVPVRDGRFHYYSRTGEGLQYPISCRKPSAKDGGFDEQAKEEVLIDPNAMANGSYLSIGGMQISDDDQRMAFSTDRTGFRQYTLHVKDLATGKVDEALAQRITSFEWAADNKTLFYVTEDDVTKRSDQLWRLELGKAPVMLWEEKDELYRIGVSRTRDKRYLLVGSGSTDTAEWHYLDAKTPGAAFAVALPRQKGHRYQIDHRDGSFFVVTDSGGATNFRVVQVPAGPIDLAKGKEIVAHRADVLVDGFDLFADYAVLTEKAQALTKFRVLEFATGKWQDVNFHEPVYSAFPGGTPDFTSRKFRISYQSMVTPSSVYDIDMKTLNRSLLKQTEVAGYQSNDYETKRLWAKARDGVAVPISIVAKKDRSQDGGPLWLYAYGSYGAPQAATFSSERISLLDRGVAFAIAHIRGGNDMGEQWHKDGMLMKKKNTFFDFIDCAEYLVAEKWTQPAKLMIEGGSAGGLLMGAVANLRPDLFKAVHSAVPFVDVMNTMMDATLPLTVGEYLEWGNPNEKEAFDYMLSYSPYDNLEKKAYPATLVTTSFNDSQVMYWEPAKYVAKLRTLKTDQNQLLLKCKLEAAGHGGASGRYDRWRDRAFEMAWMLGQVGITK